MVDVLIVEPLEAEVVQWLSERLKVHYAPELGMDVLGMRKALAGVRAAILPAYVAVDRPLLYYAPALMAVGRVSGGAENIDLEVCKRANVDVVRSLTATAQAEAEFMIGALLSMLRRVPVDSGVGLLAGRELGSCTVGLIGMPPAAKIMASLLRSFGSTVVGYDPALHATDQIWERWNVAPLSLRDLVSRCDAVCVQLTLFSRYRGLLGDRLLPFCKPNQVMVSVSHSAVFDQQALADVLVSGRMALAWLDSLEPGALEEGQPLHGVEALQITPRVASTTQESRLRSSWAVARRIAVLLGAAPIEEFRPSEPAALQELPAE